MNELTLLDPSSSSNHSSAVPDLGAERNALFELYLLLSNLVNELNQEAMTMKDS
jgi:hypothetical protein